jgi:hypothetical protein
MKLSNITISEYIEYYLSENKPDFWEAINDELNNILPSNENSLLLNLYRRQMIISVQKLLNIAQKKQDPRLEIELNRVSIQLTQLLEKRQADTAMTDKSFAEWIMHLSKYLGFRIDREKMSMLDFAVATKQMQDEQKIIMQQLKNNRKNNRWK